MDTIYTINVFKIFNIYIIKDFKIPYYSEQQNIKMCDDKSFTVRIHNEIYTYYKYSVISKQTYQLLLHILECDIHSFSNYEEIDIRFEQYGSESITPIYLDAPILDPSIHIACHIRPAFYKYNNMYIKN